jgi:transcription elongation factor GreA
MANQKVRMQKHKVERHSAIKQIRFTKEGLEKLKQEYADLQAERPDAVMHLKKAREMGDLSENGYYKASRARLSAIDGQLWRISMQLKYAVVSENPGEGIDIGCTVTFSNGDRELTYQMVGDLEANPSEGKLSLNSPIGKALAAHKEGEEVDISTPAGTTKYKILKVTW